MASKLAHHVRVEDILIRMFKDILLLELVVFNEVSVCEFVFKAVQWVFDENLAWNVSQNHIEK